MRKFAAAWVWKLESPLHCGSGISRPGVADRLVYRDHDDRVVIAADAVKGAIRMSAEQLVGWLLGAPLLPGQPQLVPLAHLFGGASGAHITAALPVGTEPPVVMVRAATSIDQATGTAEPKTLRTVEVLASDSAFEAAYWVDVPDEDFEAVETLFLAALSATESIGAKAGIGWGRVSLTRVTVNGASIAGSAAITPKRLEHLKRALVAPDRAAAAGLPAPPEVGPASARPAVWYRFEIALKEPACFPVKPEISNQVETELTISATTLRGTLAAQWLRAGVRESLVRQRLAPDSRWLPAFPEIGGQVCVPAPRSLMVDKHATSADSREPIYDAIGDGEATADADGNRPKPQPARNAWVYDDRGTARLLSTDRLSATRMHTARNYATGSKVHGALYARESLLPPSASGPIGPTRYVAAALLPDDVWSEGEEFDVLLGKRKSVGQGLARVTVRHAGGPAQFGPRPGEDDSPDVYVELLTPAIVRDDHGSPLRSLPLAFWTELVDGAPPATTEIPSASAAQSPSTVSRRSTAGGRRGSWMSTWRQPRAAVATIEAGSCWRLRFADAGQARPVRSALRSKLQIGERQHEGFGWFVVDAPWSGYVRSATAPPAARIAAEAPVPPLAWPGCPSEDPVALEAVVTRLDRDMPRPADLADARAALQHLANHAREARRPEECDAIRRLCERMADEVKHERKGWAALKKGMPARRLLDACWTAPDRRRPELLRFTLYALLARASGSSGS